MASLNMSGTGLGILSLLFVILNLTLHRWRSVVFRSLLRWWFFFFLLFSIQAFSLDPSPRPFPGLPITASSLQFAWFSCWRLAVVVAYATLFTVVTSPREIENALAQMLRFIPLIPARRVGTMVSLTLRFLPLLLAQADEVRLAFRSRMGQRRRSPVVVIRFHALPILRKCFLRAEELTFALAARGYRDDLPIAAEPVPLRHAAIVVIWAGIISVGMWMG